MQKFKLTYFTLGLLFLGYIFMSNSSNPPNGKTGAPNEQTCAQCHSGGNFNGTISVSGVPSTVMSGTTYNVTVTNTFVAPPSPMRSGFQIVALDAANTEAGSISNVGASANTVVFGGKTYVEHAPALNFNGNSSVSWTYDWTAPNGIDGDLITFYYSSVFGNGSGSTNDEVDSGSYQVSINNSGGGGNPLTATIFFENDVSCNGGSDGSAAVLAADGTPPYTYLWSDGQTTATATALSEGTYTVVVTDAANALASTTAIINEPLPLGVNIISQQDVTCSAAGEIVVQATGGDAPYQYSWPSGGNSGFETGFTSGGFYNLSITDNSNCSSVFPIQIFEDTEIPSINMPSTGNIDCTNPCFGVTPMVSSSSGNLVYQWLDNNGNTFSTNLNENLCSAGNYTFQVTNLDNGCIGAAQILINDNSGGFGVNISGGTLLTCLNSNSTLTASTTGTGANYQWTGPGGFSQSGPVVTVFEAGTYIVEATFPNGCISQSSYEQLQDIDDPTTIIIVSNQLTCTNSTADLDASNSSSSSGAPISFAWWDDGGSMIGTNPTINVSQAGIYTLTVTDLNNGCTSTEDVIVDEDIDPPFAAAATSNILNCANNTASLNGNGSSTGSNFSYIWTTINGNIVSGATTLNATANATGTYLLTVMNTDNGCTSSSSTEVEADYEAPQTNITTSSNEINCSISTITLDATGSTSPATYQWSSTNGNILGNPNNISATIDAAGVYTLIVTDVNNACTSSEQVTITQNLNPPVLNPIPDMTVDCTNSSASLDVSASNVNGNTCTWTGPNNFSSTSFIISPGSAGTYCATITGTNSCTSTECSNVTFDVNLPTAIANAPNPLTCSVASVTLNGNGSSTGANFTYFWSTSDGNIINGVTTLNPEINLAGTYTLTVVDNTSGCTSTSTTTVAPPVGLVLQTGSNNISCNGSSDGNINVNVTQGTPPYQYSWSNGANTASLSNLSAGSYSLTVTDANDCVKTESFVITEPSVLNLSLNANGETFAGANNGNAMANVSGGAPPYSYNWSNGATTAFIANLTPGNYSVTVSDAGNCIITDMVTVTEFGCALDFNLDLQDLSCFGLMDGAITAIPQMGTAPYTYLWSNGAVTQNISGLSPGTYSVTITDATQCTLELSGILNSPTELNLNFANPINIDCANPTGSVEAIVSGGTAPYDFIWPEPGHPAMITDAGTYTVTVTDFYDCVTIGDYTITADIETPNVDIAVPEELDCTNTSITLDASASDTGTGLSIEWTTLNGNIQSGANSLTPTVNQGGTYTLTITNLSNNCFSSASVLVQQNADIPAIINNGLDLALTCNQPMISLTEGNPNPDYEYSWKDDNGNVLATGPDYTITDCGNFFLCISNITSNCTAISDTIKVSCDTLGLVADAGSNQILNCNTTSVTLGGGNTSIGNDILYEWLDSSGNLVGTLATLITDICDTYTLSLTNVNTGCVASDEVVVTCTTGLPVSDAGSDIILNPNCDLPNTDFPVTLDGSGSDQGVSFEYLWSTVDGNIISGENTLNPEVDQLGTYSLAVTNVNTNCTAHDEMQVKFDENFILPTPDVLPFGKLNCTNESVTLDASPTLGTGNLSFNWFDFNFNNLGNTASIEVTESGVYTLEVASDLTNCTTTLLIEVEEEEFSYEISAETLPCRQDSVYMVIDVVGEHPPFIIDWEDGQQGDSILVSAASPLSFTITDDIGCVLDGESFFIDFSEPIIMITSVEIVDFQFTAGSIDIEVVGQSPPFTFLWSNGETTEDIFDLSEGFYTVTITDAAGCELIETYEVKILFSTTNVDESNQIEINPNPSDGLFYLKTEVALEGIELFSLSGKFILALQEDALYSNMSLDFRNQDSGVYYLKMKSREGEYFYKKVVIF